MILQSKLLALTNEVLSQSAKLRKGGMQATYFCPFCNHYKRKLEVNLESCQWHCWVCHARGSYLGSLLTKLKSPKHFRDRLFELTKDVRLIRKAKTQTEEIELCLPADFISLADARKTIGYRHAIGYLKKRGFGLDDICRYNIGYCEAGEYKDCVIIPSYDSEGKLNYFSSRFIYPHKWLKYKNAPFSKNIIGFECFIDFSQPVNLVEGAFDAMATRINVAPLFGTIMSQKLKENLILNKTPRVNLILDNDALAEAVKAVEELWSLDNTIAVHLVKLEDKDPAILGFEKTHELIEASKPFEFQDLIFSKLIA